LDASVSVALDPRKTVADLLADQVLVATLQCVRELLMVQQVPGAEARTLGRVRRLGLLPDPPSASLNFHAWTTMSSISRCDSRQQSPQREGMTSNSLIFIANWQRTIDVEMASLVIGGLYYIHTHDCQIGKSVDKNKHTIRKSNFCRPPASMKVRNGF
jgi:hypothetical protein